MSLKTCRVSSSSRSVLWNRSIFPVVVGERGWVRICSMPFSRQIRSKSTSTGGCANRPVNTLPLSVSTWSGTPYCRSARLNPSHTLLVRSRCIKRAAIQNLEWSSSPVRAVAHPLPALLLVASQPRMQRLPAHGPVPGHLRHRAPAAEDRHDRLVPLLSHAQLLHARECQASAETAGRHQPKLCKASAEHVLSCVSRIRTWGISGRRVSNSRPQRWQRCALPTELLPRCDTH